MEKQDLKAAAESVLRDEPAVVGVFVQPDAFGRPREIHLLIGPGPRPREFAAHVKSLLEDRLRIPIDQRIISIAQIDEAQETTLPAGTGTAAVAERVRLEHVETSSAGGRITVRTRLMLDTEGYEGEATELESEAGRSRAAAGAVLAAINRMTGAAVRFSLEFATPVVAHDTNYVLVAATVASLRLGRRSERVVGAHPLEDGSESAAALATLKAVNRILWFVLNGRVERARAPRFTR